MKYKDEIIIMIEYYNNIPFFVYTEYSTFDFETYANTWLMFYNSGCGQNWREENGKKIIEHQNSYYNPESWSIYVDSQYNLTGEIQDEVTLLRRPLILPFYHNTKERHNNPFVVGEEVDYIYWCEECQCHYNSNGCPLHGFTGVE